MVEEAALGWDAGSEEESARNELVLVITHPSFTQYPGYNSKLFALNAWTQISLNDKTVTYTASVSGVCYAMDVLYEVRQ